MKNAVELQNVSYQLREAAATKVREPGTSRWTDCLALALDRVRRGMGEAGTDSSSYFMEV